MRIPEGVSSQRDLLSLLIAQVPPHPVDARLLDPFESSYLLTLMIQDDELHIILGRRIQIVIKGSPHGGILSSALNFWQACESSFGEEAVSRSGSKKMSI